MTTSNTWAQVILAGVAAGSLPVFVLAQSTNADVESLEEVVVTAQKRAQRLQDVPIQVDVLTANDLSDRQIKQPSEMTRVVPNFSVQRTDTYTNSVVVIRGIAQASRSDSPVAVIVDGVPQDDVKQLNTRMFDVSQIEVLRGPQGSIYGRNAEAGAVIITTTPPTDELSGFADVSLGNRDTRDISGGISGSIVPDVVQFRLAGSYFASDGVIRNTFTGGAGDAVDYDYSSRGTLYVNLSDRVKLNFILGYSKFDAAGVLFAPVLSGDANDYVQLQSNFPNRGSGTSKSATARLEADLGFATFTSITGYTDLEQVQVTDLDFTSAAVIGNNQPYERTIKSQEFRLVSADAQRLRWLVAADVLESDSYLATRVFFDRGNPATDPLTFGGGVRPEDGGRTAYGTSAQIDFDATSRLTLTFGGRYDHDRREQLDNATQLNRHATFDLFQPRVSATYNLSDTSKLYATYAVGFRSGVFNGTDFPIADAEELTNYEVGFKTQWADRRLTLNGAVFYSDVENFQFSYIDFVRRANVTSNIDEVSIKGAELELSVQATRDLKLFSNVGYAKSDIEKFQLFPQYVGNHAPRSADWALTGGFDFEHDVTDRFSFFVRGDLQYASKRYWYYDNLDVQDPKTLWNASVGIENGPWSVSLWGKNLSSTESYDTYFPRQSTGLSYDVGFPSRPRTYGLQAAFRF